MESYLNTKMNDEEFSFENEDIDLDMFSLQMEACWNED